MERKQGQFVLLQQLPLLWISISFLIGIAAASVLELDVEQWALLSISFGVIALVFHKRATSAELVLLICIIAFSLGGLRHQSSIPVFDASDVAFYNGRYDQVSIRGWIDRPPVYQDDYIELWVRAAELEAPDAVLKVTGMLIARGELGTRWHYGDEVLLTGQLDAPQNDEDFPFKDYLARSGVHSVVAFPTVEKIGEGGGDLFWRWLYDFRERATLLLYRLYPDPEASLLAGILLGDESGLTDSTKAAFNDTGTRHIIAISGFNISIIAGVFLAVFTRWLGVRRGMALAAAGIIAYTLLVGAGASVVRAAIMGLLALLARQLGREQVGLNTLAFVAAVMCAVNPLLISDIGFQLSFAATLGLMVYAAPIQRRAYAWLDAKLEPQWAGRLKAPLYEFVFMTIAAQITTLPLLLLYFQRLSLVSLPANFAILPLQPALMILAGSSLLAGLAVLPLGQLFAMAAWPLAAFTIRAVEFFAGLPLAARQIGEFTPLYALIYYVLLLFISVPSLRVELAKLRAKPAIPVALAGLLVFAIWTRALAAPTGLLEITLLDVPGEAVLIRTPAGRNVLINAGPSAISLSQELGRMLPVGARTLDWVIVAGEREEQIGGLLSRIDRLDFDQFAWATLLPPQELLTLLENVNEAGKPTTRLQPGQVMDLGEGVTLQTLWVGQRGATMLLTWHQFQALLPFGSDFDQMERYIQDPIEVDLVLIADSGYPPLNSQDWLAASDPGLAWLSADGEPSQDLLDALGSRSLMQAGPQGWLRVTTDGNEVWLSAERPSALIQP